MNIIHRFFGTTTNQSNTTEFQIFKIQNGIYNIVDSIHQIRVGVKSNQSSLETNIYDLKNSHKFYVTYESNKMLITIIIIAYIPSSETKARNLILKRKNPVKVIHHHHHHL